MLQVEIDQNLAKFENFIYIDLICPSVVEIDLKTTKYVHFWNHNLYIMLKLFKGQARLISTKL
jgi:hypothetical protein